MLSWQAHLVVAIAGMILSTEAPAFYIMSQKRSSWMQYVISTITTFNQTSK